MINSPNAMVLIIVFLVGQPVHGEDFGKFSPSAPTVKMLADGRSIFVVEDFSYTDQHGKTYNVPKHAVANGASIPWIFWKTIGPPLTGNYRNASIIHDYYCDYAALRRSHSSDEIHLMFYNACRCGGVPKAKAKMMYWAVANFGPKWAVEVKVYELPDGKHTQVVTTHEYSPAPEGPNHDYEYEFSKIASFIETQDPKLEELVGKRFMNTKKSQQPEATSDK